MSTLENKGPEFFGFSHPTIQNLIQSCPGARKCSSYEWQKFEVTKDSTEKHTPATEDDPLVNFDALQKFISSQQGRSPGGSIVTFLHVLSDVDIKSYLFLVIYFGQFTIQWLPTRQAHSTCEEL